MPKCSEVASELRKLADALDTTPDAETVQPNMYFTFSYAGDDKKQMFLNHAQIAPKPLAKEYDQSDLKLTYDAPGLRVLARISRSEVCTLIEPAKPAVYRCEPLLSDAEDAAIAEGVQ